MSLIVVLKITNLSDWAVIQPFLMMLKISFVQKMPIWSPYDSYDAAEILLHAMKNNTHQI